MTPQILTDPTELMAEHFTVLKEYAAQLLTRFEKLSPADDEDKARRVKEYLELGRSFGCTERELVRLLLRDLLARIHRRTPMDGVRKAEGGVRELQGK